jgi:ElaB/YqjD/DUF883 family membrane-anchored ribosome-binding protein
MGEDQGAVSASVTESRTTTQPPDDPQQLREEIERTRLDLGDTVAALAEKTDVKARARDKVAEVRQNVNDRRTELVGRARESSPDGASSAATQVREKAQQNPVHAAAIGAFVGGFLLGRITSRR